MDFIFLLINLVVLILSVDMILRKRVFNKVCNNEL
jgi:hypothetical protein